MANLSNINNKFIVTDGGDVMINNTIAGYPNGEGLTIKSSDNICRVVLQNSVSGGSVNDGFRIGLVNSNVEFESTESGEFQFYTGGGAAKMTIDSSGLVSLTESLQIANTKNVQFIGSGGDHARITYTQGDGTTGDVWSHSFYQNSGFQASMEFFATTEAAGNGNIRFKTGATTRLTIDSSGNSTFAGNVALTGSGAKIISAISSDNDSSLFLSGAGSGKDTHIVYGNNRALFLSKSSSTTAVSEGTPVLTLAADSSATFAGIIDAGGRVKVSGGSTDQYYFEGARTGVGVTYRLYDNANNIYHDSWTSQVFRLNQNGGSGGNLIIMGGDVGIGEASPSQKLNVRDDGGSDVFRGIEVHNNNQSLARAGISFQCYDWVQSAIWHGRSSTAAYGGALVLGTNPNTSDLTVSGVTGRMWILNSGNVGIGTNTPTKQLHLLRTTGDVRGIMVETSVTTSYAEVQVKAASEFRIGTGGSSTVPNGQFYIYDATAGAHRFDIDANGNVGIGTTSPTAKLDINGTVRYQGNTYNQLTYQVSGNYSANTWYTIATNATLTEQGIYILVAYVEDFTAGGSNYYIHAASTNFYWDTTSTNRTTAFNFPALLGTGHATGSLPLIRITQELGTAGAQSKIQWQTPYTYTGLNPGLGGKKLIFYFKRIGG